MCVAAGACKEEGPPGVFLFMFKYIRPVFKFCVVIVEFVFFFGLDKCVEDCGSHLPGDVAVSSKWKSDRKLELMEPEVHTKFII
jgi:hypothetical protein